MKQSTSNKIVLYFVFAQVVFGAQAQVAGYEAEPYIQTPANADAEQKQMFAKRKLFQHNTGMILGLQRGRYTSIELGGEAHWRKISLLKPHIVGATTNLEYNFADNVLGYKAGAWIKRGHVNLTYGANVSYYTNFKDGNRFGIGPTVGFRLLGLHLINGYNFLTPDKGAHTENPVAANTLFMSLRYYFPVQNSFTWDRQTRKRKKERKKAREARKKERIKRRENGEGGLFKIFKKKN